jgi:hypothetical protein
MTWITAKQRISKTEEKKCKIAGNKVDWVQSKMKEIKETKWWRSKKKWRRFYKQITDIRTKQISKMTGIVRKL